VIVVVIKLSLNAAQQERSKMNEIGKILENYSPDFLSNPSYHDILSIIKGARNGAVYGAKIRFPHALVMTFLFRSALPLRTKARLILTATFQHSKNLCMFVSIYKSTLILLRRLAGKESSSDAFVAGLLGGYIVFREDNGINQQIVLYLLSRIAMGLGKLGAKKGIYKAPDQSFAITGIHFD
jgi:peroxisomal membrane protein 4